MAQTNPFKIGVTSTGTRTIILPRVQKLIMEDISTLSTENTTGSLSVGFFDEAWLAKYRGKLDNLESDLMPRMIMVYHGLWPNDCIEYQMFKYVSKLFAKLEDLVIRRAVLARRLFSICDKPESRQEYATGFPELQKLRQSLMKPIYEFYVQFGILEHVCEHPGHVAKDPEVAAFIDDLDKHTEEFRSSAWDERTKFMGECARKMQKLSM